MKHIEKKQAVYSKTGGKCWYCGAQTWQRGPYTRGGDFRDSFEMDHYIPRKKGGTDDLANLVPCCASCNSLKKDKTVEEFRLVVSKLRTGIPNFSSEQIAYLESIGVFLPVPELVIFYGERNG